MIDLHAHILPGLDDGPATEEGAMAMARAAVAAGTRAMATTSHINRGFGLGPAELAAARAKLRERLNTEGVALELLQGGEIAPDRLPELSDEDLQALTLGGGSYLLLECPFSPAAGLDVMVADLQRRGHDVLLAHPERSPSFVHSPDRLARLVERGALAQLTAGSLTGAFGDTVRRTANTMLERGLVHVLASDAHDARHRPPRLPHDDPWMTQAVPAAIVEGRRLPERPAARLRAWSPR